MLTTPDNHCFFNRRSLDVGLVSLLKQTDLRGANPPSFPTPACPTRLVSPELKLLFRVLPCQHTEPKKSNFPFRDPCRSRVLSLGPRFPLSAFAYPMIFRAVNGSAPLSALPLRQTGITSPIGHRFDKAEVARTKTSLKGRSLLPTPPQNRPQC